MSIYIDEKICKGCGLCVQICPNNIFRMKNKVNDKGFVIPELVNESKCTK
ncbi:MAG: 4Fe-4S binding protein, partial [Candidatus Atribacteria bacterium]|nr:4Fe-4S binding protein [Candidatus Atribacteria bacterium]